MNTDPRIAPQVRPPFAPQISQLSGNRLHLHHGPIDLILWADAPPDQTASAYHAAITRFDGLLAELVAELPALRRPDPGPLHGPIARAMARAVAPHHPAFITPMAAVAGAVADAILSAMTEHATLRRAYVNNGGDIALHLTQGQSLTAAIARPGSLADRVTITHADPVRGLATSGWRGRSFSLGIADAVTVLAATAAAADAAATMIANAVNLPGHPAIGRCPANSLQADTDLGTIPVTTKVGALTAGDIAQALSQGEAKARTLLDRRVIAGAALFLHPESRCLGHLALAVTPSAKELSLV